MRGSNPSKSIREVPGSNPGRYIAVCGRLPARCRVCIREDTFIIKKTLPLPGKVFLLISYFKNPLTICSSASFSESPSVISFTSCSPAILPIAASWISDAST